MHSTAVLAKMAPCSASCSDPVFGILARAQLRLRFLSTNIERARRCETQDSMYHKVRHSRSQATERQGRWLAKSLLNSALPTL